MNLQADLKNMSRKELCLLYEHLTRCEKRGIWGEVGKMMGKSGDWAGKHYLSSFKRALFPEPLRAEDKNWIEVCVCKYRHCAPNDIRSLVMDHFRTKPNIFPESIYSYTIQTIQRLRQGKIKIVKNETTFSHS